MSGFWSGARLTTLAPFFCVSHMPSKFASAMISPSINGDIEREQEFYWKRFKRNLDFLRLIHYCI